MSPAEVMDGEPVAAEIREAVTGRVRRLEERGVVPTLGTVLASDDPADRRFMDLKHAACDDVGVASRDVRLDPEVPARRVHRAVADLCADPVVHGVFVQVPLPDHVPVNGVRERLDPRKDVDCFHPETLGRLVVGDPRFLPATPAAVLELFDAHDVPTEGEHVAIVGRSTVIGRPLANLLLHDAPHGNATVTVCHSRTRDLGARTREADIVVTAAGTPGLVDGSMVTAGATVVDVSANRVGAESGRDARVVGDVDFESVRETAGAVTPVPGGVGPVTLAALLRNVVLAAERQHGDPGDDSRSGDDSRPGDAADPAS